VQDRWPACCAFKLSISVDTDMCRPSTTYRAPRTSCQTTAVGDGTLLTPNFCIILTPLIHRLNPGVFVNCPSECTQD
jgi:hypothetical protein